MKSLTKISLLLKQQWQFFIHLGISQWDVEK